MCKKYKSKLRATCEVYEAKASTPSSSSEMDINHQQEGPLKPRLSHLLDPQNLVPMARLVAGEER